MRLRDDLRARRRRRRVRRWWMHRRSVSRTACGRRLAIRSASASDASLECGIVEVSGPHHLGSEELVEDDVAGRRPSGRSDASTTVQASPSRFAAAAVMRTWLLCRPPPVTNVSAPWSSASAQSSSSLRTLLPPPASAVRSSRFTSKPPDGKPSSAPKRSIGSHGVGSGANDTSMSGHQFVPSSTTRSRAGRSDRRRVLAGPGGDRGGTREPLVCRVDGARGVSRPGTSQRWPLADVSCRTS